MRSSRSLWMPPIIIPRTILTSSGIGEEEVISMDRRRNLLLGFRLKMRERLQNGPASGFLMSGNGNTRRKAAAINFTLGVTAIGLRLRYCEAFLSHRLCLYRHAIGTIQRMPPHRLPTGDERCYRPAMWMRTPTAQVHLA